LQLVDRNVERLVDAFGPVAAAARLQFQKAGVEVLDVGGEFDFLGHIIVANVAIGDKAHADVGVGIGIDDGRGDRPDLALGAFDHQATHRAGGVEHDYFDGGFCKGWRQTGGQRQGREGEGKR